MNMFFLLIIILLILLILILIFILFRDKNDKSNNIKKGDNSVMRIDLTSIKFPKKVEEMNYNSLLNACKIILDSFRALDYKNKSAHSLDRMEWHTWQVSLLIYFLNVYQEHFIPDNKNLFHEIILELSDNQINNEIQKIFIKYINSVSIDKNRDELSKNIIWTAREVSVILYSMMCNKRF